MQLCGQIKGKIPSASKINQIQRRRETARLMFADPPQKTGLKIKT